MKRLFLSYFICALSTVGYVQSDLVEIDTFDSEKLNSYLIIYINQLRSKKNKKLLQYYPELNTAAKNHANYMAAKKYLGHFQKKRTLKTVRDRVIAFGSDANVIGENVQYVSLTYEINQSKNTLTYWELSKILGENWKNSRGHYKNILSTTYSGVAHQFAINNGLLYACQVFTSELDTN